MHVTHPTNCIHAVETPPSCRVITNQTPANEHLKCSHTKTQVVSTLDACHRHSSVKISSRHPVSLLLHAAGWCPLLSFWGEENHTVNGRALKWAFLLSPSCTGSFSGLAVGTTPSLSPPPCSVTTPGSRAQTPHGSVPVLPCPPGTHQLGTDAQ